MSNLKFRYLIEKENISIKKNADFYSFEKF